MNALGGRGKLENVAVFFVLPGCELADDILSAARIACCGNGQRLGAIPCQVERCQFLLVALHEARTGIFACKHACKNLSSSINEISGSSI